MGRLRPFAASIFQIERVPHQIISIKFYLSPLPTLRQSSKPALPPSAPIEAAFPASFSAFPLLSRLNFPFRGVSSRVYLAQHKKTGQYVAIKVIPKKILINNLDLAREIRILKQINHRFLLPLLLASFSFLPLFYCERKSPSLSYSHPTPFALSSKGDNPF